MKKILLILLLLGSLWKLEAQDTLISNEVSSGIWSDSLDNWIYNEGILIELTMIMDKTKLSISDDIITVKYKLLGIPSKGLLNGNKQVMYKAISGGGNSCYVKFIKKPDYLQVYIFNRDGTYCTIYGFPLEKKKKYETL